MSEREPVVTVSGASVIFGRRRRVQAVRDVDLTVGESEVLALVGESGSGKSTLARAMVGLQRLSEGSIAFPSARPGVRSAQMVFQDPRASLNPRLTVRQLLAEARHRRDRLPEHTERVRGLLDAVGLSPEVLDARPTDLSGGQCQRVSIVRALVQRPQLLVCDEIVSALDVSVQAQVLDLIRQLQQKEQVAMVFITHDLGVVRQIASRVAVMYLGQIVESGPADRVLDTPAHPYTQALLGSALEIGTPTHDGEVRLRGSTPSPSDPPPACTLHPRCPRAQEICGQVAPKLRPVDGVDVSCHFADPRDILKEVSVP